jgi:hypothetical protein
VVCAIAIVLILVARERILQIQQLPFDKVAWKEVSNTVWTSGAPRSIRQQIIQDLVTNVLPGRNRDEIEELLGISASHVEMQRYADQRWYYDEYDWDLIYPIGKEVLFLFDHRWVMCPTGKTDDEYLILRLDKHGRYSSWFVAGSPRWPRIAGKPGSKHFRSNR